MTEVGPLFPGAPCTWEDAFWSHTDPDLLYCHSAAPKRLYAYDVTNRGPAGLTLIHDFDADLPGPADAYWASPRVSVSLDGRHAVFTSNYGGARLDVFIIKMPTLCGAG